MYGQLSQAFPTRFESFGSKLKETLQLICDLDDGLSSPLRLNTEVPWGKENQLQHRSVCGLASGERMRDPTG